MIHAIYLRNKPTKSWRKAVLLKSINDVPTFMSSILEEALKEYPKAEVAYKAFETQFHIPEYLKSIKAESITAN